MSLLSDPPHSSPSRVEVVRAGHEGDVATVRRGLSADDPATRAAALSALRRLDLLAAATLIDAVVDSSRTVRRRAIELSADALFSSTALDKLLVAALDGDDPTLAECAAWCLGERYQEQRPHSVPPVLARLCAAATDHPDALVREAAVAALGAIGDPAGKPAVLTALADKATVRRRAVIALAAFEGPDVDAALATAKEDRDWQVRQAAEDLSAE